MTGITDYLYVEAALTTEPWAASPSWTDISTQVRSGSISRGFTGTVGELTAQPATLILEVDNRDGRWDPDSGYSGGSPYQNNIKKDRLFRVRTTTGNRTLYHGYISDIQFSAYEHDATATITCTDLLRIMQEFILINWSRDIELGGARWDALTSTDSGGVQIPNSSPDYQASWADSNGSGTEGVVQMPAKVYDGPALTAAQEIIRAEGGYMYVTEGGVLVGYDRYHLNDATGPSTSQVTFTDSDYDYASLTGDFVGFNQTHKVAGTGATGTVVSYGSAPANNPTTTIELPKLETRFDADVETTCEMFQKIHDTTDSNQPSSIGALVASNEDINTNMYTAIRTGDLELLNRITVQAQPINYSSQKNYDCWVRSINHSWTSEEWRINIGLLPRDTTWTTEADDFYEIGTTVAAGNNKFGL